MKALQLLKNRIQDLLFPEFCMGCGKEGTWLCADCKSLIDIQIFNFCPVCEKPTFNFKVHPQCSKSFPLEGLFWAARYENPLVRKLIQSFKYQPFAKQLVKPLNSLLVAHFDLVEFPLEQKNFTLVPIPLTDSRLHWRGFNQAALLARKLSEVYNLPIQKGLERKTQSIPQTKIKDPELRARNIKGAFECSDSQKIAGQNILLIDDVYTTGATVKEGAKVLKDSGAQQVWAAVVARG